MKQDELLVRMHDTIHQIVTMTSAKKSQHNIVSKRNVALFWCNTKRDKFVTLLRCFVAETRYEIVECATICATLLRPQQGQSHLTAPVPGRYHIRNSG